ncbi:orotidine-5'-phosphate decarboxylase [Acidithiobacillus sp. IBUN Pt1247-S3]|uniref:orotidine-5'-phosphate decarboxylase n=1 Tax=Acidithiobacillus sp. IBUN Pt1247-S3 TaxID=3166642 RepID=UPI0034E42AA8
MTPLIVALDFPDAQAALRMADRLDARQCRVKVGKELFTRAGPAIVESLQQRGFQVFLDLKFHDIPATVAGACRAAADLGVWMVNVHASGGRAMLEAARDAIDVKIGTPPLLIAVTVLTSLNASGLAEIGCTANPTAQVIRLAGLAADAGLDGVVCSAQEATELRQHWPTLLRVTPGIRPAGATADDQRRIVTPSAALAQGADYLVVGRPITAAADPDAAMAALIAEMGPASVR